MKSIQQTIKIIKRQASSSSPDLSDLEKLKPTRLEKYLPSIHPNYYLHQINSVSNQINRAFSKNQLINLCRSIQNHQNNTTLQINSTCSKHSLISFILFNHWSLTHPNQIKTNHSLNDLINNFKSHHQSHPLPHNELFLIHLDHLIKSNKNQISFIHQLTKNLNLKFQFHHLHHPNLTVFGQLKDRQKFWTLFQKNRKNIFKFLIHLPHSKNLAAQFNPSLLRHLSQASACYLELLNHQPNQQTNTLVAYSFDQNYPVERVLKEVEKYSILSNEYQNLPVLIELNQLNGNSNPPSSTAVTKRTSQEETSTLSINKNANDLFGFLPFSYPFKLDWPFNYLNINNDNNQNFSRLVSPTKINHHHPHHQHQHLVLFARLLELISSKHLYFLNKSRSGSIDLYKWIWDSFSVDDQKTERVEFHVYDGHYLKSTESNLNLSHNQKIINNPFQYSHDSASKSNLDSNEQLIHHLQSIWKSLCDSHSLLAQSHHQNKFIFLPKSDHPILSKLNDPSNSKKNEMENQINQEITLDDQQQASKIKQDCNDMEGTQEAEVERIIEVYSSASLNHILVDSSNQGDITQCVDGETKTSYEVIKKKKLNTLTNVPDDYYIEKVEKVRKKKLVILRPHQSTDMMIEVSIRKDVTSEVLKKKAIENDGKNDEKESSSKLLTEDKNESNDQSEPVKKQDQTNHDSSDQSSLDDFLKPLILVNKFKTSRVLFKKIDPSNLSSSYIRNFDAKFLDDDDSLFNRTVAFMVVDHLSVDSLSHHFDLSSDHKYLDLQFVQDSQFGQDRQSVHSYITLFPSLSRSS